MVTNGSHDFECTFNPLLGDHTRREKKLSIICLLQETTVESPSWLSLASMGRPQPRAVIGPSARLASHLSVLTPIRISRIDKCDCHRDFK